MEKSCLLFFEEDDQKHFRPILFRFSNNYLHPIGWPSALEIRLSVETKLEQVEDRYITDEIERIDPRMI